MNIFFFQIKQFRDTDSVVEKYEGCFLVASPCPCHILRNEGGKCLSVVSVVRPFVPVWPDSLWLSSFMACTAPGTEAYPVMIMKGISIRSFRIHSSKDIPSPSGRRTSDSTRSKLSFLSSFRAPGSSIVISAS